jgi:hypothetical protein
LIGYEDNTGAVEAKAKKNNNKKSNVFKEKV